MSTNVYGRRAIRRFERETGAQIVHGIDEGPVLTTVDHRHLAWNGIAWFELPQAGNCGVWLGSCHVLFGEPEHGFTRGLLRGPCKTCGVDCSMLHRADCTKLALALSHCSVNPDYWPRPVHRPAWLDDPRRPRSRTALIYQLAYGMDLPPEVLLYDEGPNHFGAWAPRDDAAVQRHFDQAVEAIGPDVLRSVGLDPDRYTLGMDWQPGPYQPRPE